MEHTQFEPITVTVIYCQTRVQSVICAVQINQTISFKDPEPWCNNANLPCIFVCKINSTSLPLAANMVDFCIEKHLLNF